MTIGARTSRLLFDSGSPGLRILAAAVPDGAARRTGRPAKGQFSSGLVVEGEAATGSVSIGGAEASNLTFQIVDHTGCASLIAAYCSHLLAVNDMFTTYSGVLGVAAAGATESCCANPLLELGGGIGRRFIIHSALADPTLTLNPDDAALSGFTMLNVPLGTRPLGCIRLGTAEPTRCGELIFDTGSLLTTVYANDIEKGPRQAEATAVTVGDWSHDLAAKSGTVIALLVPSTRNRIVVGLPVMQSVDVFYDLEGGRMGLLSR